MHRHRVTAHLPGRQQQHDESKFCLLLIVAYPTGQGATTRRDPTTTNPTTLGPHQQATGGYVSVSTHHGE